MSDELFTLRPAREDDMPSIQAMAYAEGMPPIPSTDNLTVAVNGSDEVVGFIRLQLDEDAWHINPVVTYPTWRRYGVGKALVEDAMARTGGLRFVARGGSVPFYRALGFEDVAWEHIGSKIAGECDGCPIREECNPQPMAKRAE